MEKIIKNGSKLKTGYTTGTCAQAAAKAAAVYLFTDKKFDYVEVNILSGKLLKIKIKSLESMMIMQNALSLKKAAMTQMLQMA